MSAPRWEHRRKSTGLQINAPTSAYQQILATMPPDMAKGITGSGAMGLMVGHQAGIQGLAGASHSQVNKFLMDQKFIDQPATTADGAKNPYFKELWEEKDYGTRNETIAGLGKKELTHLKSFESAWLEETPVTTPTDELTIGS